MRGTGRRGACAGHGQPTGERAGHGPPASEHVGHRSPGGARGDGSLQRARGASDLAGRPLVGARGTYHQAACARALGAAAHMREGGSPRGAQGTGHRAARAQPWGAAGRTRGTGRWGCAGHRPPGGTSASTGSGGAHAGAGHRQAHTRGTGRRRAHTRGTGHRAARAGTGHGGTHTGHRI